MLGLWSAHAQQYLLWLTLATTLVFALPIFCIPLVWARLMGWTLPSHTHLAVYFGRCLGAFILIVEALMLRAALTGEAIHTTFEVPRRRGCDDDHRPYLRGSTAYSAAQ